MPRPSVDQAIVKSWRTVKSIHQREMQVDEANYALPFSVLHSMIITLQMRVEQLERDTSPHKLAGYD